MASQEPHVSAHADPEGEAPWAMQIVARVEKTCLPTATAVCEAAAVATLRLLADPRTAAGGEWEPSVSRWTAGRSRKHVRRARGGRWAAATALPGITEVRRGAEVRAFVPGPTDAIPPTLARLQLQGLELSDPDHIEDFVPTSHWRGIVVALKADLPAGKAAAAAAHAAQIARMEMDETRRLIWADTGYRVAVTWPKPERFDKLAESAPVVVNDAGFTVVEPGTVTAVAQWPELALQS